jgi:hypothetical protein
MLTNIKLHLKCLENENDKFQKSLSRPSIIDARAHYWAAARRLRSTGLKSYPEILLFYLIPLHVINFRFIFGEILIIKNNYLLIIILWSWRFIIILFNSEPVYLTISN